MPKFLSSTPKHVVSAQLKRAAKHSGLTFTQMHTLCGCSSYAQLNAAFNGGSLGPRMRERIRLLAETLGIDPDLAIAKVKR